MFYNALTKMINNVIIIVCGEGDHFSLFSTKLINNESGGF